MRMFKIGGIGLGPFAFAPTGEDTWRRLLTGAPATRPGGYRLAEEEGAALAAFAEELERRPDPDSALSWAVGRFEMGCERESAMEGLSDHLLALRAVLEGHGPVGASLPLRASALIADENFDRIEARERVEEVLELERALMNGRILDGAIELATWIEDGVRRLLRQAALGELGSDLSATADETLIATGLEAGDAEITVYAEEEDEVEEDLTEAPGLELEDAPAEEFRVVEAPAPKLFDRADEDVVDGVGSDLREAEEYLAEEPAAQQENFEEEDESMDTRILEPIPAPGEIKVTATHWLDEVEEDSAGHSLEWPAAEERDLQHRERIDTPRVRHLFPVPDSDWEVSHLEFEYSRRGPA
jgi:hypothetical protein